LLFLDIQSFVKEVKNKIYKPETDLNAEADVFAKRLSEKLGEKVSKDEKEKHEEFLKNLCKTLNQAYKVYVENSNEIKKKFTPPHKAGKCKARVSEPAVVASSSVKSLAKNVFSYSTSRGEREAEAKNEYTYQSKVRKSLEEYETHLDQLMKKLLLPIKKDADPFIDAYKAYMGQLLCAAEEYCQYKWAQLIKAYETYINKQFENETPQPTQQLSTSNAIVSAAENAENSAASSSKKTVAEVFRQEMQKDIETRKDILSKLETTLTLKDKITFTQQTILPPENNQTIIVISKNPNLVAETQKQIQRERKDDLLLISVPENATDEEYVEYLKVGAAFGRITAYIEEVGNEIANLEEEKRKKVEKFYSLINNEDEVKEQIAKGQKKKEKPLSVLEEEKKKIGKKMMFYISKQSSLIELRFELLNELYDKKQPQKIVDIANAIVGNKLDDLAKYVPSVGLKLGRAIRKFVTIMGIAFLASVVVAFCLTPAGVLGLGMTALLITAKALLIAAKAHLAIMVTTAIGGGGTGGVPATFFFNKNPLEKGVEKIINAVKLTPNNNEGASIAVGNTNGAH
ncbi:MAG: hypothetical protein WBE18_03885, partial [Gammaproteobacteria bacterium]